MRDGFKSSRANWTVSLRAAPMRMGKSDTTGLMGSTKRTARTRAGGAGSDRRACSRRLQTERTAETAPRKPVDDDFETKRPLNEVGGLKNIKEGIPYDGKLFMDKLSDVYLASGGQYSGHADFVNAWNQAALSKLVASCLNRFRHCGTGS